MSFDLPTLRAACATGPVVRVLIIRTAGSVPRGPGTSMLVSAADQQGTIGGGALELAAVTQARGMLYSDSPRHHRTMPLGPALGQCCGGSVSLLWERFTTATLPATLPFARPLGPDGPMPASIAAQLGCLTSVSLPLERAGWLIETAPAPGQPLWIWGAGHVGRALISVLGPMPGLAISWIDTAEDRFPSGIPVQVTRIIAADPAALVRHAPRHADHLILTYAHALDLALCNALLSHGFNSAGLIGSTTKWARFKTRLGVLGHTPAQIMRIACPIGDPTLGKHPQVIAVSVASALLKAATGNTAAGHYKGDKAG